MKKEHMDEREGHGPFRREFKAGGPRQMARAIYSVALFIQQKDYFGGFPVNRVEIENWIAKPARFGREARKKLKESVDLLILSFSYDELLISKRQVNHIGRREKFSFKQDEDSKAKCCDLLAFFGEKAGIDPGW